MMPGMNPRQMRGMMKKMGMSQSEIEAEEVIIRTSTQTIRITNPQVTKINMQGNESYQITGEEVVEAIQTAVEITDEDIQTIISQTQTTEEKAREALEASNGDLAEAIMTLTSESE